jgi:hypothetical protein
MSIVKSYQTSSRSGGISRAVLGVPRGLSRGVQTHGERCWCVSCVEGERHTQPRAHEGQEGYPCFARPTSTLTYRPLTHHGRSHPCRRLHNHRSPTQGRPCHHRNHLHPFLHPRPHRDGASERGGTSSRTLSPHLYTVDRRTGPRHIHVHEPCCVSPSTRQQLATG